MSYYTSFALLLSTFPLQTWSQSVQDAWTAPASPDGSTNLQGGTSFTIRWKPQLQNNFPEYCPSCNVTMLDLWVASFRGRAYKFKIAGSIDITTTVTYGWDMNIPSAALAANDYWVLKFTPAGAEEPWDEQVSSSGFYIFDPSQSSSVSNTVTMQPSSEFMNIQGNFLI
ncbi:unnamed protein product [Alternaria alternata]